MTPLSTLTFRVHTVQRHGGLFVYPADETAQIFAKIAGTKVLAPETLNLMKQLGYRLLNEDAAPARPSIPLLAERARGHIEARSAALEIVPAKEEAPRRVVPWGRR